MKHSLFVDTNTNENIRATVWLTDTDYWHEYANNDAVFAIGSPTAELFQASANITRETESDKIQLSVGENGYIISDMRHGNFSEGIYCKGEGIDWWLASPHDCDVDNDVYDREIISCGWNEYEIHYYGQAGCLSYNNILNEYTSELPIRPVVCIPTSVFKTKYESSLVNE